MNKKKNNVFKWGIPIFLSTFWLMNETPSTIVEAAKGASHIGTFNGSTTFKTSSSNGINPGLFIEVMDEYGRLTQYTSEDGMITIPDTKEGAYVTQAKLLGKTKYRDVDTNEILESWEEGRNLELVSVENPKLESYDYLTVLTPQEIVDIHNNMGYANVKAKLSENNKVVLTSNGMWANPNKVWELETNTTYTMQIRGVSRLMLFVNGISESEIKSFDDGFYFTFRTDETGKFGLNFGTDANVEIDFLVLKGDVTSEIPIETIKSNTLTINESAILRLNEDVRDELDLMAGSLIQRVDDNYESLAQERIEEIGLNNVHSFPKAPIQNISVEGDISQIIGSITVPTEPLSFTLNPNLEVGQQFVTPEFTVLNDNHAPITLGVKSFKQITDVLNDVSPDKYDSWEGLNKTESKDIALALVPKLSDSWLNLNEKPYYVATMNEETIGQIKGNSSVEFSFEALHGQAFDKTLRPEYQLTFVFEF